MSDTAEQSLVAAASARPPFFNVIDQVGSYSDIFNRHLAPVGIKLEGSANDLWTNGGLMYPPPAR